MHLRCEDISHNFHIFIAYCFFAIAFCGSNGVFYNGKHYYGKDVY